MDDKAVSALGNDVLDLLRSRFRGALLGVAIGDALGAPFEGGAPAPWVTADWLQRNVVAGRYTDDTHMTLGLAESLVERRGFDGAHLAAVFARNFTAEPWRGYGAGPPEVFRLLAQGVPWDQAGRGLFGGAGSYGNGAAMRVAPVALFAFRDLAEVALLARQTALVTHAHELGQEGAVLQACALALLLRQPLGRPLEPSVLLDALRPMLQAPIYHQQLEAIRALLPRPDREAIITRLGTGVPGYQAVPAALAAFLRHQDSFAEAVAFAISLGGDTDTIASLAGALAGALLGQQAIPADWRGDVEGAGTLLRLADALWALATGMPQGS